MSGIVTLLVAISLYTVLTWIGRDTPEDVLFPLMAGPLALLSIGVVGLLINWISVVPYQQWECLENEVMVLKTALEPRFLVASHGPQLPSKIAFGLTNRTWGGTKQTNIGSATEYICIDVESGSNGVLTGCEAYIARFNKMGEPSLDNWQSIRLPWIIAGEEQFDAIAIPPKGQRSIWLFSVLSNRVHFHNDKMPVSMVHMIEHDAGYEGLVVVTCKEGATTYIRFSLVCDAPDNQPIVTVIGDE